jgi:DNA-binding CsgD family transcriptional regulator
MWIRPAHPALDLWPGPALIPSSSQAPDPGQWTSGLGSAKPIAQRRPKGDLDAAKGGAATRRRGHGASAAAQPGKARAVPDARQAAADDSPLGPRELAVARLAGRGLTNKQIGQNLYVSERTAENHVQHILTKLGLRNRSQIAARASGEHRKHGAGRP